MMLIRLISVVIVLNFVYSDRGFGRKRWESEVLRSIEENFINVTYQLHSLGNQGMQYAPGVDEKAIDVQISYPTKLQQAYISSLPTSYTSANEYLGTDKQLSADDDFPDKALPDQRRWELASDHPGQNESQCISNAKEAHKKPTDFFSPYRQVDRVYYLATAKQAFIHPTGAIALETGRFIGTEGCETRWDFASRWTAKCKRSLREHNLSWTDLFSSTTTPNAFITKHDIISCLDLSERGSWDGRTFSIARHEKVFTIAAGWDGNFHHFLTDSLTRLTPRIKFLIRNPDVKIHIRRSELYDVNVRKDPFLKHLSLLMRNKVWELMGIDRSRLLIGPVLADIAYIPRYMRCAHAASNPTEIMQLSRYLLFRAYSYLKNNPTLLPVKERSQFLQIYHNQGQNITSRFLSKNWTWPVIDTAKRKEIVLLVRPERTNTRAWPADMTNQIAQAFASQFPEHSLRLINARDSQDDNYCLACDIYYYSKAEMLVGAHGAGLTNIMFMQPNGMLVELADQVENRIYPVCGYYSALAGGIGLHHYIYAYYQRGGVMLSADALALGVRDLYLYTHQVKLS